VAPPRRRITLIDDRDLLAVEYRSSTSIAELADRAGVSTSTVQRALVRHGIARLPRNRNRRPRSANVLDDLEWLIGRYQTSSAVEIAAELRVSPRTVYAAMDRLGVARRTDSGRLKLRRPQLVDGDWLQHAVGRASSTSVASELSVSAGTVTAAYKRAGIDPTSTTKLFDRGRTRTRPSVGDLRAAWQIEGTYAGVGRRLGVSNSTVPVWLAEIDIYLHAAPKVGRRDLLAAIEEGWPIARIAVEHGVSTATVRVELHRHELFGLHRVRHRA